MILNFCELSVSNDKFSSASQWLGTAKGTNTRAIVAFEGGPFGITSFTADCDKF